MEKLLRNRFLIKKLKSINLPSFILISAACKKYSIKIEAKVFYCVCKHLNYKINLKNLENHKSCKDLQTAIKNNHLFCFKLLGKTKITPEVYEEIIKYGLIKFLKYAHEQGCPWDTWTCKYAAENEDCGSFENKMNEYGGHPCFPIYEPKFSIGMYKDFYDTYMCFCDSRKCYRIKRRVKCDR
jgi:hypothetical protein